MARPPGEDGDRDHHRLGHQNHGRYLGVTTAEPGDVQADQRHHRGVGQVEKRYRREQHDDPPVPEQRSQPRPGLHFRPRFFLEVGGANQERARGGKNRHNGDGEEHGRQSEPRRDDHRGHRRRDVPGVVPPLVLAHHPVQGRVPG